MRHVGTFFQTILITIAITIVFFRPSIWMVVPFAITFAMLLYVRLQRQRVEKEQRILAEFGEMMTKMNALLQSGHPLDTVFADIAVHLEQIYGATSLLKKPIDTVAAKLAVGIPVETALFEFANHFPIAEIIEFAEMVAYVKRGHGNLSRVLADTTRQLSEHQKAENEIQTMIQAKEREFSIMRILPLILLTMIRFTAYSFVASLYETFMGQCFLAICFGIFLILWLIGERLVRIEV